MNNFKKSAANAISLVPGSNHGAIPPLDWSPRGGGVKLDCVWVAVSLHEQSGLEYNQTEIDSHLDRETDLFSL
jgi:hypothetical protein